MKITLGCFLAILMSAPAQAVTLYWDTNGNGTDATYGGDGTWNTTNTFWNTSATIGAGSLQAWNNAASPLNTASFLRGTTGTVTVSGTVQMLAMGFGGSTGSFTTGTTSYTLNGGTLDIRQASFGNAISNSNGSNTINSDIHLFALVAATTEDNRQRISLSSGTLTLGNIQNISSFSGTGVQSLSLESFGTGIVVGGNITKSVSSDGTELLVGGTTTTNTTTYTLNGNNTGLTGVATLNRGSLVLNNSGALAGATSLTVANANSGGSADTAQVLIGTDGVTINKSITFNTLGTDTTDVRVIGGSNTTGTSTYSGTVTLGAFAASGTGSSLQVTSATGGTTVFSGNITDGGSTVALTKTGNGIVKFTRSTGLTYDGGTTVSAGTLLVNNNTSGSGTGTGAVTVSTGATFGGTGTVTGAITISSGGRFSAGDMDTSGVSTADSFNGSSFTLNSNDSTASMLFDLGTTSDLLTLSGAFTKGTGTDFLFNFEDSGGLALGTYTLINFASTDFVLADLDYTSSNAGLSGNFIVNSGSLQFQLTTVPEPSTYALLGFGALALWALRRKQGRS